MSWLQRKDLGSHKVQLSGNCYAQKLGQHSVCIQRRVECGNIPVGLASRGVLLWCNSALQLRYLAHAVCGRKSCSGQKACLQRVYFRMSPLSFHLKRFLVLNVSLLVTTGVQQEKMKWNLKTGFAWGLYSGPQPIPSFPSQTFAKCLSYGRTKRRLLGGLA